MLITLGKVATGLLIATSTAFATAECISQTEMQEIAQDFSQFQPYANQEYCLDGSELSNLLEALVFMKHTQFESTALPRSEDELFSGRFQNDWYGYFTERIKNIEIDRGCPKGVGAYVYGYFSDVMYVCTMILTTDFTGLDRASIFMHEARHMDGFPHTTCPTGARAGVRGACDHRISDGGSYAVSVETYAQLAKYAPNLHPGLRAYARASAITYADEAFATPVRVNREPALLVMTQDQHLHKLTSVGGGAIEVNDAGSAPTLGRIAMRGSLMVLFPEDRALNAKYIFQNDAGDIAQQAGTLAGEYNSMSQEQRSQVIDTHMGGGWSVQVKGQVLEFMCDRASDAKQNQSLGSRQALGFVYPDGYSKATRNVIVATQSGEYLEAGCQNTQSYVRASTFQVNQPLKRIYKVGDLRFGLDTNNQLYSVIQNQATAVTAPGITAPFELAPIESLSFFD